MPRKSTAKPAITKTSLSAQLTTLTTDLASTIDELHLIRGILVNAELTFRAPPGEHTAAEWEAVNRELEVTNWELEELRAANSLLSRRLEETFAIRGQEDKSGAYTTAGLLPGYENTALAAKREQDLLLDAKDLKAHNVSDEVTPPVVQRPRRYNDFIVCQSLPVADGEQAKAKATSVSS